MSTRGPGRADVAAMASRVSRAFVAAERPILDAVELSMWEYIVLSALYDGPLRTQSALAEAIGADKTRIIPVLDQLEVRSLIVRQPDPNDRRARILSLTDEGVSLHRKARSAIRSNEDRILQVLPESVRRGFVAALSVLDEQPPELFFPSRSQ